MTARLPTALLVNALVRMVDRAGGSAAILARGDRDSGGVLFVAAPPRTSPSLWERGLERGMIQVGPPDGDDSAVLEYWSRRRRSDPDLWVIEANVAGAERFAEETVFAD